MGDDCSASASGGCDTSYSGGGDCGGDSSFSASADCGSTGNSGGGGDSSFGASCDTSWNNDSSNGWSDGISSNDFWYTSTNHQIDDSCLFGHSQIHHTLSDNSNYSEYRRKQNRSANKSQNISNIIVAFSGISKVGFFYDVYSSIETIISHLFLV